VTRPGMLYCLFLQDFAHPRISDKFPHVSGTESSDGKTEAKRASTRPCSCKSASAEGKNGNTDLTPATYWVTSQLPCRRSNYAFPYPSHLSITLVYRHEGARFCMRRRALVYRKCPFSTSALSRLRIGVADFGTYWEAPDHKEVSHEQEVRCASVG